MARTPTGASGPPAPTARPNPLIVAGPSTGETIPGEHGSSSHGTALVPPDVVVPAPRGFGWPTAVLLLGLVTVTFTFALLLLTIGKLDPRTTTVMTLALLSGTAVVVLPAATGTAMLRKFGSAAAGAVTGWRR